MALTVLFAFLLRTVRIPFNPHSAGRIQKDSHHYSTRPAVGVGGGDGRRS